MAQTGNTANGGPVYIANDLNADKIQNITVSTTAPSNNQILKYNSSTTQWEPVDTATDVITSVLGRTGDIVSAASDYDASQIDNDSTVAGDFVDDALNNLLAGQGIERSKGIF